jgi:hypothetical protein
MLEKRIYSGLIEYFPKQGIFPEVGFVEGLSETF